MNPDGPPNFEVTAPSAATRKAQDESAATEAAMADVGEPVAVGEESAPVSDPAPEGNPDGEGML